MIAYHSKYITKTYKQKFTQINISLRFLKKIYHALRVIINKNFPQMC